MIRLEEIDAERDRLETETVGKPHYALRMAETSVRREHDWSWLKRSAWALFWFACGYVVGGWW